MFRVVATSKGLAMQLFSKFFGKPPILELTLKPKVGVGPLLLGMTKADAIAAMKANRQDLSSTAHGHLYFLDNSIQIEFEPEGTSSFIGVAPHAGLRLVFQGIDLFDHDASEIFALFQQNENDETIWAEQYEHVFPKQIVTVWDADAQYDLNGGHRPVWGQIGVGSSAYLSADGAQ